MLYSLVRFVYVEYSSKIFIVLYDSYTEFMFFKVAGLCQHGTGRNSIYDVPI